MYTKEEILKNSRYNLDIQIVESLPSTNTSLRVMALDGAPEGVVLLAREQTAGRGRHGHSFFSPKDTGVYMSVLLRPSIPMGDALRITTAAAVAAAEATQEVTTVPAKIKWVNDLFCHGKKVCGILTEGVPGQDGRYDFVILGIGINLQLPQGGFPEDIAHIAGAVQANQSLQASWIAAFLNHFFDLYQNLYSEDIHQKYVEHSLLLGQAVSVVGHEEIHGIAEGIDKDFCLLLRTEHGTIALDSGEVSIRKM